MAKPALPDARPNIDWSVDAYSSSPGGASAGREKVACVIFEENYVALYQRPSRPVSGDTHTLKFVNWLVDQKLHQKTPLDPPLDQRIERALSYGEAISVPAIAKWTLQPGYPKLGK